MDAGKFVVYRCKLFQWIGTPRKTVQANTKRVVDKGQSADLSG